MSLDLAEMPEALSTWLVDNGLAILATVRRDGSPHATMVGANWDPDERIFRIISSDGAVKVANMRRDERVALTFSLGGMWATFDGTAVVTSDPDRIATAVNHYERRFPKASVNPQRVAIEVTPTKLMGRWG